ncbi:hypothetical protein L1987_52497 [Smallanthus sonchifolius]|uniref:Uncharacterized protein n=1 Tax=Smallanthus sonchifolius TaxID=185202 RepID=A0ACB9ESY9_9ASTR|nr:hypothetical protein L1987_52497 [Smallanthus sonchifolius]
MEDVAAPSELANHIVLIIISRADEAHPIHKPLAVVVQILKSNNRKIHEAYILLVVARVHTAVSKPIRDGIFDEVEQIGLDSKNGDEETDVEDDLKTTFED